MDADGDKAVEHLPEILAGRTGQGAAAITVPAQIGAKSSLDEILVFARKYKASDVHISPSSPIIFRQFGKLTKASSDVLSQEHIQQLTSAAVPPQILEWILKSGDAEFVHVVEGFGRF